MADRRQCGRFDRRPRYLLVPRSRLDLHPYDGEARSPQFGGPETGDGPLLGEGAPAPFGQHRLVGHGAAVQHDTGEFQAVQAGPPLQARTGGGVGAEPHGQMLLELPGTPSRSMCLPPVPTHPVPVRCPSQENVATGTDSPAALPAPFRTSPRRSPQNG